MNSQIISTDSSKSNESASFSVSVLREKQDPKTGIDQLKMLFAQTKTMKMLLDQLRINKRTPLTLNGLVGSSTTWVASVVFQELQGLHLFILDDKEQAAYFYNDLQNLVPNKEILFFPESSRQPYQQDDTDNANVLLRAEVLNSLTKSKRGAELVVTYPAALAEKVVNKKTLIRNAVEIKVGASLSIDFMLDTLMEYQFERVDFVYKPGQFSIRGGIIDIFSYANDYPYRIEFFGDDIETIRTFDVESQLSVKKIDNLTLLPNVQGSMLLESRESFLEFMGPSVSVWCREIGLTKSVIADKYQKAVDAWENIPRKEGQTIVQSPPDVIFEQEESFTRQLLEKQVLAFGLEKVFTHSIEIDFRTSNQPAFRKNFKMLMEEIQKNESAGIKTAIFSDSPKQIERLFSIFEDLNAKISFYPFYFALHAGFVSEELKLAFYTDHQIFERYHKFKLKDYKVKSAALTLKEIKDLQKGDFVTHIDHGIGVFDGLERLEVNGRIQEAVRLIYAGNDLLYVGVNSLHKIAKYAGKEGGPPKIHKLGSDVWNKLKSKTKSKVKDIAKELIALYAKRKAQKGFAFTPDSYLQTELEMSFMYEDTPDQEKATIATKADMERDFPMDRLVCGDVGFGKTEIAIRAAFKAVTDGKQVAVMVPTTILALQHYRTFSERLKDFPCRVDYINRFRSSAKKTEVYKDLADGKVDILIGTHGIAAKNVKFRDLGLLIIDEEQKFGVGVKEKLRQMRVNVDTLTLTATPIPRTLQFSLMGARDLSVINTPPPNRQPVQTELLVWSEDRIRDAIMYEVDRGGQVFFVHNRVMNIKEVAGTIKRLCPDVKICIGHGQMPGDELEDVLLEFIDGHHDVLVATNIIESGLDIPNANTIIINMANAFGLSDLHQMRGRVGRSNKKAFCYLLTPPLATLTSDARKRLQALEEYSDLGSGFSIAMKDLDIRGAGNMLGAEQSGFISDIGFDMYQKILNEAITELKENDYKDIFEHQPPSPFVSDCQIDTDFQALIPDYYIRSTSERLTQYMDLDATENEVQLKNWEQKLIDRFGPVPEEALALMDVIRLRWAAKELGMEKVILKNNRMRAYFPPPSQERYYQSETFGKVLQFVQTNSMRAGMVQKGAILSLEVKNIPNSSAAIETLNRILAAENTNT